jgi:hypothetical protein
MTDDLTKELLAQQHGAIKGYQSHDSVKLDLVNENKEAEERILRMLDTLRNMAYTDKRWVAVAQTHIEIAFMAANRSILCPQRLKNLPEDDEDEMIGKDGRLSPTGDE